MGAALTAAEEMRGVLRQLEKRNEKKERKKAEVKEGWRREVVKETKIQNKGIGRAVGGEMHKRQATGRKKTRGVKIHHGISGEREGDSCRLRGC